MPSTGERTCGLVEFGLGRGERRPRAAATRRLERRQVVARRVAAVDQPLVGVVLGLALVEQRLGLLERRLRGPRRRAGATTSPACTTLPRLTFSSTTTPAPRATAIARWSAWVTQERTTWRCVLLGRWRWSPQPSAPAPRVPWRLPARSSAAARLLGSGPACGRTRSTGRRRSTSATAMSRLGLKIAEAIVSSPRHCE